MGVFKLRFLPLVALVILGACQTQGSDPPDETPTLTLTPASLNVNAGDAATTFIATVQNSTETVTWSYSGPGSIAPSTGPATSYTPPASVDSTQSGSLTAVLGSTGVSATAPIVVYPADVTPPPEPPPVDPADSSDPTDASDPTDPTDASDPTDATDPSDGSDPTDPTDPEPPPTSYTLTVTPPTNGKITAAGAGDGIDCGTGGTDCTAPYDAGATAVLTAVPDTGWEVDSWGGGCSGNVGVDMCTLSMNADQSASVSFKMTNQVTVAGVWDATYDQGGTPQPFMLDLEQNGEDVTGTWAYLGSTYPTTGTFDGTNLDLTATAEGTTVTFDATVSGDNMSGTISAPGVAFNFTATRQP